MIMSIISFLILTTSLVSADTFDLHIRSYCPAGSNCNHNSWTDYEDFICEAVEEVNLEYKKLGFSFRPTIFPNDPFTSVQIFDPFGNPILPPDKNQYSEIDIGNGCRGDNPLDNFLQVLWRDNVAAANPTAISMMLDENWSTCCSNIARTNKPGGELYGLYCDADIDRTAYGTGTVWAHELGHHWGLVHTFTKEDPATNSPPFYDGDAIGVGGDALPLVLDTPDDPEKFEACPRYCDGNENNNRCNIDNDCPIPLSCLRVCESGHDEDEIGNLVDGHVWINFGTVSGGADTGSPHPDYCEAAWMTRSGGQTIATVPAPTYTENAMSYYGQACRGPVVIGGWTFDPFSLDQRTRMKKTREMIPVRNAVNLPDVCSPWGDSDNDGICDNEDNCQSVSNLCNQTDSDGDQVGDLCDNCLFVNNPDQGDLDGDCTGFSTPYNIDPECGDACDDDLDGDGCDNDVDQHPDQRIVAVGTIPVISGTCGGGIEYITTYVDEKEDLDSNGLKNCEDCDDDGDGLCDPGWPPANWQGPACSCTGIDPCPIDPDNLCNIPLGNPIDCPPPWLECLGGSCVQFFLKFKLVINPDPTREIVFDNFQILKKTLYVVTSNHGTTPSEQAMNIENLAQSLDSFNITETKSLIAQGSDELEELIRLEIWKRATPFADESLAAVVGEWPASAIQINDITRGGIIRLTPFDSDAGGQGLRVSTTWAIGIEEGTELPDKDSDGWPDIADNCVQSANENQFDADKDGFGNLCDPDLDNDGKITEDDIARARACEGANLLIKIPILEGEELGGDPDAIMPDPVAAALAAACRYADVNGDWLVDSNDTLWVKSHLGEELVLNPNIEPLPPFTVRCIEPEPFEKIKLDILHLNRPAGSQKLHLKGEMVLPHPFTPELDPASNGLQLVIRTAQGDTLLDTKVKPDEWKINADDRHVEFHKKTDHNQMKISLEWGDPDKPGSVMVNVIARDFDLLADTTELPLFVQLSLNASTVAVQQCTQSDFKLFPETPYCFLNSKGDILRCR
jgi:hypothetical protein